MHRFDLHRNFEEICHTLVKIIKKNRPTCLHCDKKWAIILECQMLMKGFYIKNRPFKGDIQKIRISCEKFKMIDQTMQKVKAYSLIGPR